MLFEWDKKTQILFAVNPRDSSNHYFCVKTDLKQTIKNWINLLHATYSVKNKLNGSFTRYA